jgi:hypothetical protein
MSKYIYIERERENVVGDKPVTIAVRWEGRQEEKSSVTSSAVELEP